jgi:UDP-glucose:tetrahydrobiopterin glucosyltransferase
LAETVSQKSLRLLFVSTSVGALGSGEGGGVELTLKNTVQALVERGHQLLVLCPKGSHLPDVPLVEIGGELQVPAQTQARAVPVVMPSHSVLANMWAYARKIQGEFDIIVNFAYDWLPFYLTPFLQIPVAHLVSMGSLNETMDSIVGQVAERYPSAIAVYTRTQAETFPFAECCVPLGSGLDLSLYEYCGSPEDTLCWLGRISPEKGLEDAVEAAQATGFPLQVLGQIQDQAYFDHIQQRFPGAFTYLGFLDTAQMQQVLRRCRALLVTSRWVEAFGNVLIEALACGVPVISYRRGGPAEIVRDGETGWLVEPDSVEGLIAAIRKLDKIDRYHCRQQAEQDYSLSALGERTEAWLASVVASWPRG